MILIDKEIRSIIKKFKDKDDNKEPLDGDEVDILAKFIKNRINIIEGNKNGR